MRLRALDRKLLRDLWRTRAQAAAVAMVVASGVALFVASVSTYRSLRLSQARYYEDQRFADVWAPVARAPASVAGQVATLPGVARAQARIAVTGVLTLPGHAEPSTGLFLSVPDRAGHAIDDIHIRRGRHVEPGAAAEVMVSEPFADNNDLDPGDRLTAVISGRRVDLHIAGVALSPEFVMQVPPGSGTPDDTRFGVFWMATDRLAALTGMQGSTNELVVELEPDASPAAVTAELDRLLEPHGALGAYARADQVSHVQLEEHIRQLKVLSLLIPTIFLLVAAFLVNVVVARIVRAQRGQIGMLKAFGYTDRRLAVHYLEMALAMVGAGVLLGVPIGVWLGRTMAEFYASFFRFPVLVFRVEPGLLAGALGIAVAVSLVGALGTLLRVVRLPPAEAMRPEAPPAYRRGLIDRLGVPRLLSPASRMILRNLARRPVRSGLSALAMSLAVAIVVLGNSSADSLERMIQAQFETAQREDIRVAFASRREREAARDFTALPGVLRVEPYRAIPVRLHAGPRQEEAILWGLPADGTLRRIVDGELRVVPVPPEGVLLNRWTARRLGVAPGTPLAIELREGERRVVTARVVATADEPLGMSAYIELGALGRLVDQPETISGVHLAMDPTREAEFYGAVSSTPVAASVTSRLGTLANFRGMSDASIDFIRRIELLFAVIIAFGVVYNAARIALAERGYELATLRVLGFTRREVSAMLIGETALLAVPAVPVGYLAGRALSAVVAGAMGNDSFRMPLVVDVSTYAFATVVFLAAALGSALVVRRRLDHLDLVAVLKARE